jgi:predicted ArsR family transcriptional regulator
MAEPREREWAATGEYEELYSPKEVYELMLQAPQQVVTTADISDVLGCTRRTARDKLKDLQLEGKVTSRDTPGHAALWYPAEDAANAPENSEFEDVDARLKQLSREIDGPITTADGTVYEDGDKHTAGES